MKDGLWKFVCPHANTTPEDGTGCAICVDCGIAVVVRLTYERLRAAMDAVLNQK